MKYKLKTTILTQGAGGPALVEIIVIENEGKTLVNGLHITPAEDTPVTNTRHEA